GAREEQRDAAGDGRLWTRCLHRAAAGVPDRVHRAVQRRDRAAGDAVADRRGRQRDDHPGVVTISWMRANVASMSRRAFLPPDRMKALDFSFEMSHVSVTRVPPSTGSNS